MWEGYNINRKHKRIMSFVRIVSLTALVGVIIYGKQKLLFIINMTPVSYPKYKVGVPEITQYKLILNSDDTRFGGNGNNVSKSVKVRKGECDRRKQYIAIDVPPLTALVYKF